MFDAPSEKALPRQGDPRKFAQQGVELRGYVPVSELERLAEALATPEGRVYAELAFKISEEGKLVVQGAARAELDLMCQRCLSPVNLPIKADIALAMVRTEEAAKNLPKYLDPWILEQDGVTDLYEMVEDELLLSLPAVAYHPEPCINEHLLSSGDLVEDKPKENPFQVLEHLKGSPKK